MDYFNSSSKDYDTHGENYLIGIHQKDYQDLHLKTDENFTFIGITNSTNATSIEFKRDEFLAKIEQSVLCLIFVLTISGNFLVLMGIYFRNQKMTRMYYFIVHLSIADLTTAFFNVLTQLFWEFTHRFQGGAVMCKFVKYTQILGPYSSSYILVMTALDRYQAICYPLSNCSWTAGRSKLMLGTAWALSFLFCLPQLHIFNYEEVAEGVFDCWGTFAPHWGEKAYITWYCITVFIIPLFILIFAYTCITRVIWLNFSMKNAVLKEERPSSKGLKRVDSDDMEDTRLEDKIEENESPIFRGRSKYSSERHLNARNTRKSLVSYSGECNTTKDLEVCWHHRKQGTETRASLKISTTNILSIPCTNQCKPCSENLSAENNKDSIARSPYFDGQYMSNAQSYKNEDEDLLKQEQSLMPLSHETHATVMSNGSIHTHGKLNRDNKVDRKLKWRSMSARFRSQDPAGVTTQELELEGPNGDYHKKTSRQHLLASFHKGKKTTRQASKSPIVKKSSTFANNQPRTHSVKGISRAKIKTVKLTVTVICCYIICSTPFIAALLWSAFDPYAKEHPFFFGPTFTILTLLASLNSCANSWIVLFFNPNLLQSFVRGTCRRKFAARERQGGLNSMSVSQRRPQNNKNVLVATNSHQMTATSVTGLSPLMSRFSKSDNLSNRSSRGRETMELIPPVTNTSGAASLSTEEGINVTMNRNGRDATIPIETSFIAI